MKVVVVEDNLTLQKSIAKVLKDEGHSVEAFSDGESARKFMLIEREAIDLAIIDYMLPELDGVELIRVLRAEEISVPALMLTARDSVSDKVTGLESGADYYLTKPFEFDELLACMQALRRRPQGYQNETVEILPGLTCNLGTHMLDRGGEQIPLTPTEFGILECLIRAQGSPVSQTELGEHVFDFAKENWSNSIEVHIKNLRKKVTIDGYENPIKTIRGVGYALQ